MRYPFTPVVTGIGMVTPAGADTDTTWAAVRAGRVISAPDPRLKGLPVSLSCRLPEFDHPILRRRSSARLDPIARMGLVATAQALDHARLDPREWDSSRVAVISGGGGGGGAHTHAQAAARLADRGPASISPYFLTGYLVNMVCANIALHFQATGPCLFTSTACASGTTAIGTARDLLATNQCDIALVCGTEAPITPLMIAGFTQMGALSNHSSRPFDIDRDGFVIAEGAATLVLERPQHAAARRCAPLASIIGYASTTDAHHLVRPHPQGQHAEQAIRRALTDAGITPHDIDHVNAHGTSTPLNDRTEAAVLQRVLPQNPPVTSTKGTLGHALGAAGTIEAALTILALRDGVIPPTAGLIHQDPDIHINIIKGVEHPKTITIALSNSFGFGGHNATLILSRGVSPTPHKRPREQTTQVESAMSARS